MRHLPAWRDWRRWIPAECPGCGRRQPGQGLCAHCLGQLAWDRAVPYCPVCRHPLRAGGCPDCPPGGPAYDRVVAAFAYAGLGRDLLQAYKTRRCLALAPVLADHLAAAVRQAEALQPPPDWIVPVPARRQGVRARGFSPAAELARLLAARLGVVYALDRVHRRHDGARQAGLNRAQRLHAPQGVYACGPSAAPARGGGRAPGPWAGARVAVVDDVLTTGATLQAVARVLKAAGVAHVQGWVLARTVSGRFSDARAAAPPGPDGRALQ
ncbi:ComF family protein [Castellaniella hirudinis]|uniref:ComF family protein n=1 Tax=Castellaniella hirudinis TaxID=1144617 RepID=UPI0039C2EF7F